MTQSLDRKKPYGRICGEFHGAVYEQDGRYFSGTGEFMFDVPPGEPSPAAAPAPEAKPAQAAPQPEPEGKTLTIGAPETPSAPEPVDKPPLTRSIPLPNELANIDLKAWRRGETKLPWYIAVAAVHAQYSEKPVNIAHAHKIIDAD